MQAPSREDFEIALQTRLQHAKEERKHTLGVRSGDLHQDVGGYPGPNHQMSLCCDVMREAMGSDDTIESSESNPGPNLLVRYRVR